MILTRARRSRIYDNVSCFFGTRWMVLRPGNNCNTTDTHSVFKTFPNANVNTSDETII
jgi:hypothetical protein